MAYANRKTAEGAVWSGSTWFPIPLSILRNNSKKKANFRQKKSMLCYTKKEKKNLFKKKHLLLNRYQLTVKAQTKLRPNKKYVCLG